MIEEFKDKYQELAAKKRAELEGAINRGEVQDPFSSTIIIGMLVSAAISAASFVLTMALAPKPPKQSIGKLSGSLSFQNSEQGLMIPEIYGAGPVGSTVAGSNPTYQNVANASVGGDGSITKSGGNPLLWDSGATHNTSIVSGNEAFFRVVRGGGHAIMGFFTSATYGTANLLFGWYWLDDETLSIFLSGVPYPVTFSEVGDTLTVEIRQGRFRAYNNGAEYTNFSGTIPAPAYPLWAGVMMYSAASGVSNAKVQINSIGDPPNYSKGGIKVPAIIDWSSGIRKIVSVTEQPVGGGKGMGGGTQTVENFTYKIDLGLKFCRGPVNLLRAYANADVLIDEMDTSPLFSGVYDPTVGADDVYDPESPPDPATGWTRPIRRIMGQIPYDGDGVGTGALVSGSNFAIYTGTETQEPDPTEESDIDAKYGTGSTTAHRGKARIVFNDFDLSRWGGIVPNMTAAWEHQTLTNLSLIYASLCERVNVKTANGDYDWTGLATIKPRGMLIAGRLFSPSEVIGSPEIQTVYNYFATEAEGQLVGFIEGAEPSVTIADTQIGWMESDGDVADILPEVDTVMASEINLPRQVDVKYIDLDKDWDVNTQSDNRQITEGVSTDLLEVQLALLASEARTAAQRKLYRDYVAGSVHKFTLPWTYLYLYPGYRITITRTEGFSHVLKLTSISGGLGVLECEGVAIETAAFTQPAVGSIFNGTQPPQSIPAMTILSLLDTPFLRDGDSKHFTAGYYAAGVPRTGVEQSWSGFSLYQKRNNDWGSPIGKGRLPATIGTVVSATGLNTTDTSVFDRVGVFVVDLYGTTNSLSSVTEADLLLDPVKNLAVFGNMVSQFGTATQVGGFPNRWNISVLLNGRKGTDAHITDDFTGVRFALVNEALVFIPAEVNDINNEFDYRGVTVGQSLTDAAIVPFTWSGGTAKPLPPSSIRGERDSDDNLLILWNRRTRIGAGMRPYSDVPIAEEIEKYIVEIYNGAELVRTMKTVYTGMALAALFEDSGTVKFPAEIDINTVTWPTGSIKKARTLQAITETNNFIEATLDLGVLPGNTSQASIGFINAQSDWRGSAAADYLVTLDLDTGTGFFNLAVSVAGVSVFDLTDDDVNPPVSGTERIRVTVSGSEVRFCRDYSGAGTPPFYVSPVAPTFPLHGFATGVGESGTVVQTSKATMTINPQPATIYTADQATEDGLPPVVPTKVWIYQVSSIVGRGGYAEHIFDPFSATSIAGMKLWLKADALVFNDGDAVTTWTDLSGAGNNATQATANKKPLWKFGGGLRYVRFDGVNDEMDIPSLTVGSVFIVARHQDAGNYPNYAGFLNSTADHLFVGNGAGSTALFTSGTFFAATDYYVNGVQTAATAPIDTLKLMAGTRAAGAAARTLSLGNDFTGGTFGKVDITEVIVYDSVLSAGDRQYVETYLMDKYGL